MAKEIKQKIVLDGEKEYNQAIREAQRNLRTLRSELKAETAELGANATAQQKAEVRAKSLQQQIKEQEEIVRTYQEALKEVTEKYGDNEDVMARWEQKLNYARTALANSRNELTRLNGDLGGVGDSMGEVTKQTEEGVTATKSFADALASVGNGAEAVSGTIESIFSGMLETIRGAAQEVWQLITETAAKANGWSDLAAIWGTDAQTIQQWDRALQAIGKDYNQLNGAINKIVLGGKGKAITELLGISDVNYTSEWEYAIAVLRQLRKESESGKNMTPIYEQIFGAKKATDVMDLVNNWQLIEDRLPLFNGDEGGFGMTSEELKTMNNAHIEINTISTEWEALKGQFAAGLGTVTLDILANVRGGLEALNDFFNADTQEERDAALETFKANVEEAFRKVGEAIRAGIEVLGEVGEELEGSDDPIVSAIGTIMKDIRDALEWMTNNADKVKNALKIIFGTWLIAKLGAVGAKLTSLIAQIKVIKKFSAIGGASTAATAAGGTATAGGGGFLSGLGTTLLGVGGLGLIGWGFGAAANERKTNPNIRGSENAVKEAAESEEGLEEAFTEYVKANRALEDALSNPELTDEQADAIVNRQSAAQERFLGMEGSREMLDRYSAWLQENGKGASDWDLPESMAEAVDEVLSGSGADAIREAVDEVLSGHGADELYYERPSAENSVLAELPGLQVTPEQRQAAENFWDAWKAHANGELDGDTLDDVSDALDEAFDGQEELLDQLDLLIDEFIRQHGRDGEFNDFDNLPDWWFGGAENRITGDDLQGFRSLPGMIQAAVQAGAANGVSGISVTMDGYAVGQIVAPYVSQYVARDVVS